MDRKTKELITEGLELPNVFDAKVLEEASKKLRSFKVEQGNENKQEPRKA